MYAVVTDVKYRMALALIRELGERGVPVAVCHAGADRPFAFRSKWVREAHCLPDPAADEKAYLDKLFQICAQLGKTGEVPVLLPAGATTLGLLARPENRKRFATVSRLCLAEAETLDLANDKDRISRLAQQLGVPVPTRYTPQSPADWAACACPLVIKPLCGEKQGLPAEARYCIARTPEQALSAFRRFTFDGVAPVVQQYIDGEGVGYSVIAAEGRIVNAVCHRRVREYPLSGGPSTCCETIDGAALRPYAQALIEALHFSGPAMLEFKRAADGTPYLLEINPRLWGTFPLSRRAGCSLGYDWFCLAAGLPPLAQPPKPGVRMYYLPSELRRAAAQLRRGHPGQTLAPLKDWLLPGAREGILEWTDPRASCGYLLSYLKRGAGR